MVRHCLLPLNHYWHYKTLIYTKVPSVFLCHNSVFHQFSGIHFISSQSSYLLLSAEWHFFIPGWQGDTQKWQKTTGYSRKEKKSRDILRLFLLCRRFRFDFSEICHQGRKSVPSISIFSPLPSQFTLNPFIVMIIQEEMKCTLNAQTNSGTEALRDLCRSKEAAVACPHGIIFETWMCSFKCHFVKSSHSQWWWLSVILTRHGTAVPLSKIRQWLIGCAAERCPKTVSTYTTNMEIPMTLIKLLLITRTTVKFISKAISSVSLNRSTQNPTQAYSVGLTLKKVLAISISFFLRNRTKHLSAVWLTLYVSGSADLLCNVFC